MHDTANVQASRLQQEDFSMLSPLPMRKINASMAVGEKSGMKRIAPTPIVAGTCCKKI